MEIFDDADDERFPLGQWLGGVNSSCDFPLLPSPNLSCLGAVLHTESSSFIIFFLNFRDLKTSYFLTTTTNLGKISVDVSGKSRPLIVFIFILSDHSALSNCAP